MIPLPLGGPDDIATMYTDASKTGWGAILFYRGRAHVLAGSWSQAERLQSINILELTAIRNALTLLDVDRVCPHADTENPLKIRLLIDNTSALTWFANTRSRVYRANEILKQIADQLGTGRHKYRVVEAHYVESSLNRADGISRIQWTQAI